MRERPILFSAPMVQAILAGRKTQTRRLISDAWWRCLDAEDVEDRARAVAMCPHGVIGDRLWVRETHQLLDIDGNQVCAYRATCEPDGTFIYPCAGDIAVIEVKRWRPAIHMPRWASRLTLEITGVRVERLQSISERDAIAEGVDEYEWPGGPAQPSAVGAFIEVWDRLNAKRAPWSSNPWVFPLSFRPLDEQKAVSNG